MRRIVVGIFDDTGVFTTSFYLGYNYKIWLYYQACEEINCD